MCPLPFIISLQLSFLLYVICLAPETFDFIRLVVKGVLFYRRIFGLCPRALRTVGDFEAEKAQLRLGLRDDAGSLPRVHPASSPSCTWAPVVKWTQQATQVGRPFPGKWQGSWREERCWKHFRGRLFKAGNQLDCMACGGKKSEEAWATGQMMKLLMERMRSVFDVSGWRAPKQIGFVQIQTFEK